MQINLQVVEAVQAEHRALLGAALRTLAGAASPGTSKMQWITAHHVLDPFFAAALRW